MKNNIPWHIYWFFTGTIIKEIYSMQDSVFNYNITLQELDYLGIILSEEEYLYSTSRLKKFYDLHTLFILRKDDEKAKEILNEASVSLRLSHSY